MVRDGDLISALEAADLGFCLCLFQITHHPHAELVGQLPELDDDAPSSYQRKLDELRHRSNLALDAGGECSAFADCDE